ERPGELGGGTGRLEETVEGGKLRKIGLAAFFVPELDGREQASGAGRRHRAIILWGKRRGGRRSRQSTVSSQQSGEDGCIFNVDCRLSTVDSADAASSPSRRGCDRSRVCGFVPQGCASAQGFAYRAVEPLRSTLRPVVRQGLHE